MKRTSRVLGALAAGAMLFSQGAAAQALGRNLPLASMDDGKGGFNAHFGDSFAAPDAGQPFRDLFTFHLGTPFDAAASASSSYLNTPRAKDLLITGFSLYRYDPSTMAILGTPIAGIDQTGFGAHPTDAWSLSAYGLVDGDYALQVDGRVLGAGGAAFGGDLLVSAVPEPRAWGMLLAGLGLGLARVAPRRKPVPGRRRVPH